MRGYLSFILVFVSVLLLVCLAQLRLYSHDFAMSKAIAVSRTYYVQMNVKEAVLELARQGAVKGFSEYDVLHDIDMCRHCRDHMCLPQSPVNYCDDVLCSTCFRENEAREAAVAGAVESMSLLVGHAFDPDFSLSVAKPTTVAHLEAEQLSQNGVSLESIQFLDDAIVTVYFDKFEISAKGKIPKGCIIYAEGAVDC